MSIASECPTLLALNYSFNLKSECVLLFFCLILTKINIVMLIQVCTEIMNRYLSKPCIPQSLFIFTFFPENSNMDQFGVALGYTAHLVSHISRILFIPLQYPIKPNGSRSTISDHISEEAIIDTIKE